MTGPSTANKIISRCLQYFIASILLATGIGKALDIPGFTEVLITYQALADWMLYPVAIGATFVEIILSIWLFSGRLLSLGALSSLGLHAVFTIWTAVAYMRGQDIPNCGCFGVFFARPLDGWTIVEDFVMVGFSAALFVLARRNESESFK